MSLARRAAEDEAVRFPRVSGDEPATHSLMVSANVFSPRERG